MGYVDYYGVGVGPMKPFPTKTPLLFYGGRSVQNFRRDEQTPAPGPGPRDPPGCGPSVVDGLLPEGPHLPYTDTRRPVPRVPSRRDLPEGGGGSWRGERRLKVSTKVSPKKVFILRRRLLNVYISQTFGTGTFSGKTHLPYCGLVLRGSCPSDSTVVPVGHLPPLSGVVGGSETCPGGQTCFGSL